MFLDNLSYIYTYLFYTKIHCPNPSCRKEILILKPSIITQKFCDNNCWRSYCDYEEQNRKIKKENMFNQLKTEIRQELNNTLNKIIIE